MKPTCQRAGVPDHGHGRTGTGSPLHGGGPVLSLFIAAALAWSLPAAATDAPDVPEVTDRTDADAAFDAAWERLRAGALTEARDAATTLATAHPERAAEAGYLLGIALWELGLAGDAMFALDGVAQRWPDTTWAHDARFRRAAYLAGMGRVTDARAELDLLAPWKRFSPADQRKLALCDLTWRLRERGAAGDVRALERLLVDAPPDDPDTLFLAYGWLAVLDHHARRASAAAFVGGDTAQLREVRAVGGAINASEAALEQIAALPEPGVRIEGALLHARALASVGDALIAGDVPPSLTTPEQQAAYREGLHDRAVRMWGKALALVELSRSSFRATGPTADALRAELDVVAREITARLR